ncbi:MAG: hypothetical protein UT94_C0024G0019 [Candidatus Uhrbacteria bacterium GW2011_GWF2_40_263]|nr:MAG: hypothetical protein UT94_C0024G0019 [Candidatus Uhrbacteria bacterium GW2011_GWF2_40_263]
MKNTIRVKRLVSETKITCDLCGKHGGSLQLLYDSYGYGSDVYSVELCDECIKKVLFGALYDADIQIYKEEIIEGDGFGREPMMRDDIVKLIRETK